MVSKPVSADQSTAMVVSRLVVAAGLDKKLRKVKAAQNVILVGLVFAALFWVFESIVDVVLFNKGTLFSQLFTPDLYQIWMRVLVICTIIMFGVYTKSVLFERKNAIEQLAQIAVHDNLTGLPNRVLLYNGLEQAMTQAKCRNNHIAVMVLDLDSFKRINDTFGHHVGDDILKGVGERLRGVLRKSDTAARMGGDEFIIVLAGIQDMRSIDGFAERLRHALSKPFEVEGHSIFVTASIGIALYPENGENAESLVRHADIAMYDAKDAGRDCFRLYSGKMGESTAEKRVNCLS